MIVLAQLADYDHTTLDRLRELTSTSSDALANLWQSIDESRTSAEEQLARARTERKPPAELPEQYLVLIECADEEAQRALLERFQAEGLKCRALLS